MRIALGGAVLGALLAATETLAEASSCRVELPLGVRVIVCDEDPAVIQDAMARAQAPCAELPGEDRGSCYEAVAESFALRRESMIRRALRAGAAVDAIASRYGASPEEVQQIQAEMAPRASEVDPEAQARAAEELRAIERELEAWRLEQASY